jgi:hypothetical protein
MQASLRSIVNSIDELGTIAAKQLGAFSGVVPGECDRLWVIGFRVKGRSALQWVDLGCAIVFVRDDLFGIRVDADRLDAIVCEDAVALGDSWSVRRSLLDLWQ